MQLLKAWKRHQWNWNSDFWGGSQLSWCWSLKPESVSTSVLPWGRSDPRLMLTHKQQINSQQEAIPFSLSRLPVSLWSPSQTIFRGRCVTLQHPRSRVEYRRVGLKVPDISLPTDTSLLQDIFYWSVKNRAVLSSYLHTLMYQCFYFSGIDYCIKWYFKF